MFRAIILLFIFSSVLVLTATAQYRGGVDDGMAYSASALVQNLGANIYKGGNDDGFAIFSPPAVQPLGQNIYKGGNDDGFTMFSPAALQLLGMNIFKGGNDDGFTMFSPTNTQLLGINIFKGGNDDGWVATAATAPAMLGANIYKGGSDDGWAMAIGTNLVLVPVTLVSYTAEWQEKNVLNRWQTSSEQNTDHFEIQRSIDGNHFSTIGKVAASGNSNTLRNYSFNDINVNNNYSSAPPKLFYRLKTVDKDGEAYYSAIVVLANSGTAETTLYTLYPNPANQQLMIETKGSFKKYTLRLVNASGQVLIQKNVSAQKELLHTGPYPSGTYYVQIVAEDRSIQSFKILIVH